MITYFIKFILCSFALLLFYRLFLEKEKMHHFNRFYLLASILFSLTIPLVSIELTNPGPVEYASVVQKLNTYPVINPESSSIIAASPTSSAANNLEYIIPGMYAVVTFLLTLRLILNFNTLLNKKKGKTLIDYHQSKLVLLTEEVTTFSFLNYIFVNEKLFREGHIKPEILTHELAHVQQKHTLDLLFTELVSAVFWINPLLHFYKKAITLNHEFLADGAVLNQFENVQNYQLLLLDNVLHAKQANLTSSFNYSITKNRLIMMTKNSNRTITVLKKAVVPLLTASLAFVFCEKIYSQNTPKTTVSKVQPIVKPEEGKTPVDSANPKYPRALYAQKSGSGLSLDQIREFEDILEKHTNYTTNKKGRTDRIVRMPPALKDQMYERYTRMDKEQQQQQFDQGLIIMQMDIPVKKAPTPEMFENWKRPTVFGIWINDKQVPNSELDKYKYSDIAEYDLSKLYGAALKGRIYKYQLNLLTNDHFDKTYEERVLNRVIISRTWLPKAP
jgi:bla regulator protein BlaR1